MWLRSLAITGPDPGHGENGRRLDIFEAAELAHLYGISLHDLAADPTPEEVAAERALTNRKDKG